MLITKKLVYQAMHDDDWFHMHMVNRMTRHVQATNPQPAEGGYTYRVCGPGSPSRIGFSIHEHSVLVMPSSLIEESSLKNFKTCKSAVSKIYSLNKINIPWVLGSTGLMSECEMCTLLRHMLLKLRQRISKIL